jgi:hypothetical protein
MLLTFPCLSRCTSIKLKWIKDLNIRPETLKLVQERAGNIQELIGLGNDFLNRTQMTQQLRERIDKWDYMKLKSFCTTQELFCILILVVLLFLRTGIHSIDTRQTHNGRLRNFLKALNLN